jgi:hypothetical protein
LIPVLEARGLTISGNFQPVWREDFKVERGNRGVRVKKL